MITSDDLWEDYDSHLVNTGPHLEDQPGEYIQDLEPEPSEEGSNASEIDPEEIRRESLFSPVAC